MAINRLTGIYCDQLWNVSQVQANYVTSNEKCQLESMPELSEPVERQKMIALS